MNDGLDIDSSDSALRYGSELLRGQRVSLRATTDEDIDTLAGWWQLNDWAVLQQATVRPRSRSSIIEMFRQWSSNDSASGVGLSVHSDDDGLVGHAALWGASIPARIATYAIFIGPPFVGRGLGTDATTVMLRYALRELGYHKVELQTWSFNSRAIRAYEKAGFVREGVRRAAVFHDGKFYDEILMGVVVEDFESTHGKR